MIKLFETIKIVNGEPKFLEFHNHRLNDTRRSLLGIREKIDLKQVIKNPPIQGTFRCKIIYADNIESIDYIPYYERHFKTFKIIENDEISYNFKYFDRNGIDMLLESKGQADDILIIKQGFVTDTSIANVAFWQGKKWITPNTPLLKGTARTRLLKSGKIFESSLKISDLKNFSKIAIMNALLDFYEIPEFELYF